MEIKLTREEIDKIILKNLFDRGLVPNTNRSVKYGITKRDGERDLSEEPEFIKVENDLEDIPEIPK